MNIEETTIKLIQNFEGCRLQAYQDVVGVWTIGYGCTYYEDGAPIKQGDIITQQRADELLINTLKPFADGINKLVTAKLTQNQFDSLVSLSYNIGRGNFAASTLLHLVNKNPNDSAITLQFQAWCHAGGKVIPGLLKRRTAEANNYFKLR